MAAGGSAAMIAFTTSNSPSIAAANRSMRAPCAIRHSAMSRLPTCAAAPRAVSQSPPPQSHVAFASVAFSLSSSFTLSRSPCAALTNASTVAGSVAIAPSPGSHAVRADPALPPQCRPRGPRGLRADCVARHESLSIGARRSRNPPTRAPDETDGRTPRSTAGDRMCRVSTRDYKRVLGGGAGGDGWR